MAATLADAKALLEEALRDEVEAMLQEMNALCRGSFAKTAPQQLEKREPKRSPFIQHK